MFVKMFEDSSVEAVQRRVNRWMAANRSPVEDMRLCTTTRGPLGLLGTRYCVMLVLAGAEEVDGNVVEKGVGHLAVG